MNKIQKKAKDMFNEYVQKNGRTPSIINCRVEYKDDNTNFGTFICIEYKNKEKFSDEDELIFFYCEGIYEFVDLCSMYNGQDFYVTEIYGMQGHLI